MARVSFFLRLIAIAVSLGCQSTTSIQQELCREYSFSPMDGPSGRLFLGESGHYVFEWQGYSCVGEFVPLRYATGTWEFRDTQVFLEPELRLSPGGLHVLRSGRAFILANDYVKTHLESQLKRWGAVMPMSLGDFRSAGVKLVSDEELRQILQPPPSTPPNPGTPHTPATPGVPRPN